jgi:hypothetical protein
MNSDLRARFWIEFGLAAASAIAAVLTLIEKDWIEIVFRMDPDHHSGSLELGIAAALSAIAIAFVVVAPREWRASRDVASRLQELIPQSL